MKLSSETFVQGFAKTSVWLDDRYEAFFILSLIEAKLSFSWLNKDLFLGTTLRNPAQFPAQFALQIPFRFISRTLSKTTVVFGFYVSDSVIVFFSVIWNGAKHRTF